MKLPIQSPGRIQSDTIYTYDDYHAYLTERVGQWTSSIPSVLLPSIEMDLLALDFLPQMQAEMPGTYDKMLFLPNPCLPNRTVAYHLVFALDSLDEARLLVAWAKCHANCLLEEDLAERVDALVVALTHLSIEWCAAGKPIYDIRRLSPHQTKPEN